MLNSKSEYRNPKQIRNPNVQNSKQFFSNRKRFCFENSDFEHLILFRISDFGIINQVFAVKRRCSNRLQGKAGGNLPILPARSDICVSHQPRPTFSGLFMG